ncbi:hypothetical protein GGR52DRAFT_584258 [Hypoxylon sp. FL1284]|nr:hypothetical protein GGR52DRAFT_584258 [Hypoxylon sp. FL1284]
MENQRIQEAVKARERGNELYKEGHLSQAIKLYTLAADLTPDDPTPLSNLSAASLEAGDYPGCVEYTVKAMSMLKEDPGNAEKTLANINPGKQLESLRGSLTASREFATFSPHPRSLRESLLQLPRTRQGIQDGLEFFACGNDKAESLYTAALAQSSAKDPVLSLMFCGAGDARNLFRTLAEYASASSGTQKLHVTMLDHNSAIAARGLIFLSLMHESVIDVASNDTILLSLCYIYFTQIMPPFAWENLQKTLSKLMDSVVGSLKSWQHGLPTTYEPSQVRDAIAQEISEQYPTRYYREYVKDHEAFDKFRVMFPPTNVLPTLEPDLSSLAADLQNDIRGTQKRIFNHLNTHWKVNATLIDVEWESRRPPNELPYFGQVPFEIIQYLKPRSFAANTSDKGHTYCIMSLAVEFFEKVSLSILKLKGRLMIGIYAGDMMDMLERLRYGHAALDPQDAVAEARESSSATVGWPQKYHVIHTSNIPDYIGGSLTSFLYAGPVLMEGSGTGVTSCVLRNPLQWRTVDHFNAEYLIMHDREGIRKHFLMKLGERDQPSEMPFKMLDFGDMASYHRWEKCRDGALPLEQLMPQPSLSRWLCSHFLKICLPFPRPKWEMASVYAPHNMTVFLRLLVQMAEVGYPGHWLSSLLTSLCSGSITTTARAPRRYVLDHAAADAKYPSRTMNVKPWAPEVSTLATMWRGVLPFAVVAPRGILPSPETIVEYSIYIPPCPASEVTVPHFALAFWDERKWGKAPKCLRLILLDDETGHVQVCIWRVDTWMRLTPSRSMLNAFRRLRTWKECVTSN